MTIEVPREVAVAACEAGDPFAPLLCQRTTVSAEVAARTAWLLSDRNGPAEIERWCAQALAAHGDDVTFTAAPLDARAAAFRWATQILARPVVAARTPSTDWQRVLLDPLSAALNRLDEDAHLELETLADAEMTRALKRVGLKVTQKAGVAASKADSEAHPWRVLAASIDPRTAAHWRELDAERVIRSVPPTIWATIEPDALALIEKSLADDLAPAAADVIARRQAEMLDVIAARLAVPAEVLDDEFDDDLNESRPLAVTVLVAQMVAVAASRIRGGDGQLRDEGGQVSGRATTQAIADTLAVAGGAGVGEATRFDPRIPPAPVALRAPDGRPMTRTGITGETGLAHGPISEQAVERAVTYDGDRVGGRSSNAARREVAEAARSFGRASRAGAPTTKTRRWVHSSSDPFDPHKRLDGMEWDSVTAMRQATQWNLASFPYVQHLRPGDHHGCRCSLTVTVTVDNDEIDRLINEEEV